MVITHIVQFGFKSSVSPDVVKDVRYQCSDRPDDPDYH